MILNVIGIIFAFVLVHVLMFFGAISPGVYVCFCATIFIVGNLFLMNQKEDEDKYEHKK